MPHGGGGRTYLPKHRIIGRCFVCARPLAAVDAVTILDPAGGVHRKVHRGPCADKLGVSNLGREGREDG